MQIKQEKNNKCSKSRELVIITPGVKLIKIIRKRRYDLKIFRKKMSINKFKTIRIMLQIKAQQIILPKLKNNFLSIVVYIKKFENRT